MTSRGPSGACQIAAGKRHWTPVLADFYGPFAASVERATAQLPTVPRSARPVGTAGPARGKGRQRAPGRARPGGGRRTAPASPGVPCPGCRQGTLVARRAKADGRAFYGCDRYPACRYTANERPAAAAMRAGPDGTGAP